MAKRGKQGSFLAMMEEAKKQKIGGGEDEPKKINEEEPPKTADEAYQKILSTSTPCDVYFEYLYFLKRLPKLLTNVEVELVEKVKSELNINEVKRRISEQVNRDEVNLKGDAYPILDALSFKLGLPLRNILAPPCQDCLLCEKPLIRNNKPTVVPLHTLNGPELASKYSWERRSCKNIHNFDNKYERNARVYYQIDQFGNRDSGFKKYPVHLKVDVFRSSSEEYFSKRFLKGYMADLQQKCSHMTRQISDYGNGYD